MRSYPFENAVSVAISRRLASSFAVIFGLALSLILALSSSVEAQGLLWVKQAGGTSSGDAATAVAVDSSGNLYVAGNFQGAATFGIGEANQTTLSSAGNDDLFLAKYSSSGLLQWVKRAGGSLQDRALSIALDTAGNVYVTGYFQGSATFGLGEISQTTLTSAGGDDIYVAQYNSSGFCSGPGVRAGAERTVGRA